MLDMLSFSNPRNAASITHHFLSHLQTSRHLAATVLGPGFEEAQ